MMTCLTSRTFFFLLFWIGTLHYLHAQCPGNPAFSISSNKCANSPVTFVNESTNDVDQYHWKWNDSSGNEILGDKQDRSHTFSDPGKYNVTLMRTCGSNRDSVTKEVVVGAIPETPVITNSNANPCGGEDVVFEVTNVQTGISYNWDFDDNESGQENNKEGNAVTHGFTPQGGPNVYEVKVVGESAQGCKSEATTTNITIKDSPKLSLVDAGDFLETNGNFTRCLSNANSTDSVYTFRFQNTSSSSDPNTEYSWEWGDGSSPDIINGLSTEEHTYGRFGVSTLNLTGTNPTTGCVTQIEQEVINEKYPSASLIIPTDKINICEGTTVTFSNKSENATSFEWVWGDGGTSMTTSTDTISHTFNLPTDVACELASDQGERLDITLFARNSCFSHDNTSPIFVRPGPNPKYEVDPSRTICKTSETSEHTVRFDISSCPDVTLFPAMYTVNFGDNFNSDAGNPNDVSLNSNQTPIVSHVFKDPGAYPVSVTATNSCGTGTYTDTIYILEPAVASFTNGDNSKNSSECTAVEITDFTPDQNCVPVKIDLINTSTNLTPFDLIRWSATTLNGSGTAKFGSSNGAVSGSRDDNIRFTEAGEYQITLEVANDCNDDPSTACAVVYVKDIPDISNSEISGFGGTAAPQFIQDNTSGTKTWIACGEQGVTTINVSNPDTTITAYNWNITGLNATAPPAVPNANLNNPGEVIFSEGEFQLDVSVENECGSADLEPINVSILEAPLVDAGGEVPSSGISECSASTGINGLGTVKELVVCSGETLTLGTPAADNTLDYIWSSDGALVNPDSINVPETTITPVNTGTVTTCGFYYVEADNGACTTLDSVLVVVKPAPVINIGTLDPLAAYDTLVCVNHPDFTLQADPAGGTWSGGAFVDASGTFDVTTASTGIHVATYSYTEPGPDGCTISKDLRVSVADIPPVALSLDTAYCASDIAFDLNASASPAGGVWTSSNASAITNNGVLTTSAIGIGNSAFIYYTFEDANGCIHSDTSEIAVKPIATVDPGLADSLCQNATPLTLSGATPAGGVWKGKGATLPAVNAGILDPTSLTPGDYEVLYVINEGTPCVREAEKGITIHAITDVDPGGPYGPYCADDAPQSLNAIPAGGAWTGPAGAVNLTATDTLFDPAIAGEDPAHQLIYTYTNEQSCISRDTVEIPVQPLPVVDAGSDQTICVNNDPYELTGFTPLTGGSGSWRVVNPSTNTVNNAGEYQPTVESADTLVYRFSLPSGCFAEDTLILNVIPPVQADAGLIDSICADQGLYEFSPGTISPFDVTMGSRWEGPGVVTGTNALNTELLTDAQLNTFQTYTYYYGGGNCVTSDTVEIKIFSLPEITPPTIPGAALCEDDGAVIITGYSAFTPGQSAFDSTSGSWAGPGVSSLPGTNGYVFDPDAAGAGAVPVELTYSYTDQQTAKCASEYKHELAVAAIPEPIIDLPALYCSNTELVIDNQSQIAFGNLATNDWDFGDGEANAVQNGQPHGNGVYTFTKAGEYTVSLRVVSAAGCDSSITGEIKVVDPPKADFTLANAVGCGPLEVSIEDNSLGYDSVYSWNFGNGFSSATYLANDTMIVYDQGFYTDTVYVLALAVSNLCGADTTIDSVKVLPKPIAAFGTDKNVGCSPAAINFNNTSTGVIDGLPTYYTWNFGDGTTDFGPVTHTFLGGLRVEPIPPEHSFIYEGFNDTTYTIKMVAVNQCGSDSAFNNVKVLPNDVKAFFNQNINDGCTPLSVEFTDYSTNATHVSYSFGDGTSVTARDTSHLFINADNSDKTFQIYQYANNGCSYDTIFQEITVFPKPKADFAVDRDSLCEEETVAVENLSTGINSSSWDFGDGTPQVNNINTDVNHQYMIGGDFTISLVVTESLHNCPDTIQKPIKVNNNPVPVIGSDTTAGCQPLEIDFNSNLTTDADAYRWVFKDGDTTHLPHPIHTFTNPGTYHVDLIASNNAGCADTTHLPVTVHEKPMADFVYSHSDVCSYPIQLNLQNQSSVIATAYEWLANDTPLSTAEHPDYTVNAPGTTDFKLIAVSAVGCKDSLESPATFEPLPMADFSLSDYNGCDLFQAEIANRSLNANAFTWYFGDNTTSNNAENRLLHFYKHGTYSIALSATSNAGCRDSVMFEDVLHVEPKPYAEFTYTASDNLEEYGRIDFFNTSEFAVSYHWDLGDETLTVNDSLTFNHRYENFGNHQVILIATNQFGCKDTTVQIVEVPFFGNLYVPNAFTPDFGPQDVRVWKPVGMGLKKYRCQIYDTWGNLIWESSKLDDQARPAEGWDGTLNGKPLPQNAYVWKIEATFVGGKKWTGSSVDGEKKQTKGTITLLR